MTYIECVYNYLMKQTYGSPIYTNSIAEVLTIEFGLEKKKAAAAAAVAVKRIMDGGSLPDLRFYKKGIYYRTVITPFGEMSISNEKLIANKYLQPDKGYETGLGLLHQMGLTTQMPTKHVLASNAATDSVRYDSSLDVSVRPPKTPINAENKLYLQTLDALELLDKAPIDVNNPYLVLANHIRRNNLKYEILLQYADKYYDRKTILQLAHTAGQPIGEKANETGSTQSTK